MFKNSLQNSKSKLKRRQLPFKVNNVTQLIH